MKLKFKITYDLITILCIAIFIRLAIALTSDHIYYADELFQALEQGFRYHHGFGIISREFVTGVRSWILPGFIGNLLQVFSSIGLQSPSQYIPAVKIVFALLSISLIVSIYFIIKSITQNKSFALISGLITAIWYEFVYFSFRPFYVVVATYTYYMSLGLMLQAKSSVGFFFSGSLLALTIYLRPQYIPLVPVTLIILFWYRKKVLKKFVLAAGAGFTITCVLAGFIDYITWDAWFHSIYQYLSKNLSRGVELMNDPYKPQDLPTTFYFSALVISSFFLSVFSIFSPKKLRPLLLIPLTIILTHTLIDHKEYRFIFAALPIIVSLSAITIFSWLQHHTSQKISLLLTTLAFSIVSLFGIHNLLPNQSDIYFQRMLAKDPVLHMYKQVYHRPEICGLFDASRVYELTGGYYYLGRNIPLYNLTYPPNIHSQVNLIISRQPIADENYQLIDQQQQLFLYYSPQCGISPTTIQALTSGQ